MVKYPVRSSQASFVGYNPETKELQVTFVSGGTYSYAQVPPETVAKVMFDKSFGSAFDRLIKKGGFAFVQVVSTVKVEA